MSAQSSTAQSLAAQTATAQFAEVSRTARKLTDAGYIRGLAAPRPARVWLATALLWAQLVLVWAAALAGPLWLLPACFLVVSAVIQGMLLWTHEASHFTLFADRRRNDLWCDVFFSAPIGMSVAAYRAKHNTHHAHFGTAKDEDHASYFPPVRGARSFGGLLLRTLSGAAGVRLALDKYLSPDAESAPVRPVIPRWLSLGWTLVFNLALLGLCVAAGRWWAYPLLWLYPVLTVAVLLNVVRTSAEHQPAGYPGGPEGEVPMRAEVRTTLPNPLEKWLLYQANFNYHVEHHLFPRVPQHNLRELHAHLRARGFYDTYPEMLQPSGFARFRALIRGRQAPDRAAAPRGVLAG
jgi:fatty acid desaturase